MNLELTRKLLIRAHDEPGGHLRVTGRDAAREVELLAEAGFVDAVLDRGTAEPGAVIERLTDTGKKLLKVLRTEAG